MMKTTLALVLLFTVGCVGGREIVGPEDPQYTALCADSTLTDSTKVCADDVGVATVVIIIPNLNPPRTP
jgi:hypothetical protein